VARDITSGFQAEIEASRLRVALLFKAEFDSGDLRLWTGYGELIWNGEIYTGSGDLLKLDSIAETQELVANGASFELSGVPSALVSIALNEPYDGRKITANFAVMDDTGAIIADPYQIFSGLMDVMETEDDGTTGTISIASESDLITLRESDERRYTDEDQKSEYPDDTGFSFVARIQDIELTWGAGL
jgi:hypothetical protein